jgi:hypothetical protein
VFASLPPLLATCLLASCGPAAWNQQAEYLSASTKTEGELKAATIQDYIADLPPSKVLEPDTASLKSKVASAPVEDTKGVSHLTLAAAGEVPERRFFLNKETKTLRMTVSSPISGASPAVHVFQRQESDWYYWIEAENR